MSSHQPLRDNKTCQNCGNTVEFRFCSNCGQENTDSRQTFGHLIRHFFEDITHYEGKFWKTLKYLLFKPSFLTKEYLSGKRMKYVPPVRLYIFISFITFFLPYIIPGFSGIDKEKIIQNERMLRDSVISTTFHFTNNDNGLSLSIPNNIRTKAQVDSLLAEGLNGYDKYDAWFDYRFVKMQKYTPTELGDRFKESFGKSFPKALFIYMPLFALVLSLFHRNKKWFYFDHAIFTIHYFSFLLLVFTFYQLFISTQYIAPDFLEPFFLIVIFTLLLSYPVYFIIGHKKMYEEGWIKSTIKSLFIYTINLFLFAVVMACLTFWAVMSIH
jgi:hypothetical protein